ncbi:TetR family transcriptional regulator [Chromohalobacter japonicus]|uniref:TetR family transcriptional regulator n=1 Tax=Chromohalobacter japonicus TaxID=223900 RepID=A0A1Q8TDM4_9GAMM|nr:TetR/AcrR family transcriptional regulator [Chromohalobacter japonicus]OLO11783.1 TetR family transcriptional regulator [Chromohalobacter japonicus]CDQ33141.1 Bacterial regulatory proteins, tetR family [Virgibacillus halodenitrificans]
MPPADNRNTKLKSSRDAWLDAAFDLLLESGVDSVRILPLAKRLELSRTSFYWFFKNREELLHALIERWRQKNTQGLVNQTKAYAETITEAILNVFDCWLDPQLFDSQLEFAIRSWALQSQDVSQAIETADETRIEALTQMFIRFGHEPLAAGVRGRTIYLTQIGYISLNSQETQELRMRRIPSYVEIFTGQPPQAHDLRRFHARHAYTPEDE